MPAESHRACHHRLRSCAALAAALCGQLAATASGAEYRDLTLEQALKQLKRDSLSILYSSDLVKPWMRVQSEPAPGDPRTVLRQIIAPHGLALTEGPRGHLMLVRARSARAPPGAEGIANAEPPQPPAGDLAEVIVTASHYEFLREPELSLAAFSAADLELMPDIGDDPLRAVARLPGTAATDFSAKANLRGGETDEALILFDGLRLFNPFHFKDFHSVFSTIDPGVIDAVRIFTGGFPAPYGDRMSGVIDIAPLVPKERIHREIALSLFNASGLATGRFEDGGGDWIVAARRGHPDFVLDLADSSLGNPDYIEFHARLRKHLSDALAASVGILSFHDRLDIADSDQEERASADYRDDYLWLRFDYAASGALAGTLMLARTELESARHGTADQDGISSGELDDRRAFTIDSLQTDWSWRAAKAVMGQLGAEWRRGKGRYDYRDSVDFDLLFLTPGASLEASRSRQLAVRPSGDQYGAYGNLRIEPFDSLTLDAGLRWDKEALSSEHGDQVSPRIGMRYRFGPRTELRASWGRYFQGAAINELQIADGVTDFHQAQRSEHLVMSVDYRHPGGMELRLEAYRKAYRELRPRFENLLNTAVLLPELKPDRIRVAPDRALAKGAELTVRRTGQGPWSWWASYTWASVEDDDDVIEARRTWDQTHFVSAGLAWQTERWEASCAGVFHSGRPTTAVQLVAADPQPVVVAGPRNAQTLDSYLSVDARIARHFRFQHGDLLTVFFELRNLTNRSNDCCVEYEIADPEDGGGFDLERLTYPRIFPSLGFVWQF
ncbi:MAG TPA: TonB-dependent receptor [Steroidobacteraceae bacterium]|nr:TonB-dependent receptor [Steroidobacteraceae bacterium]